MLFLDLIVECKILAKRRVLRHATATLALPVVEGLGDLHLFALPVLREEGVGFLELAEYL